MAACAAFASAYLAKFFLLFRGQAGQASARISQTPFDQATSKTSVTGETDAPSNRTVTRYAPALRRSSHVQASPCNLRRRTFVSVAPCARDSISATTEVGSGPVVAATLIDTGSV